MIRSTALLTLGVLAASTGTAQAAEACDQPLNPDRRSVYSFKNGSTTLGFGRVVVQATAADPHRYCFRVQFGGRTPLNDASNAGYRRVDGRWVYDGAAGGGGFQRGPGYELTVQVPDRYRTDRVFQIKHDGRVYSTIHISRYNL